MRLATFAIAASAVTGLAVGELPSVDSYFSFDGTTSDLSQQLYRRYLAGDDVDRVKIADNDIPENVQSRLSNANITAFSSLPGIAQRALLWDSGFVFGADGSLKQIWPLDGRSMANLAVPLSDFLEAGCTAKECEQPNGEMALSNHFCNGKQMLSVARCVAEDDDVGDQNVAMWATGGNATIIPELRLIKHEWASEDEHYLVFAVHTLSEDAEPQYDQCPSGGYGSVNIPCSPRSTYTGSDELQAPTGTSWVDEWLHQLSSNTTTTSNNSSSNGSSENSSTVTTVNAAAVKGMFDEASTSSDIARQLFIQYQAGASIDAFEIDKVPDRVLQRLEDLDVTFENIPPIAQRALLWDSGYSITGPNEVKEIWVLPDRLSKGENATTANIGVTLEEFTDISKCVALNCSQPNGHLAYSNLFCNGVQMLASVKCTIEDFEDGGDTHMSMWSTGGNSDVALPEIRAITHQWEDGGTDYLVYGIHTMVEKNEPSYGQWCPAANGKYGALTIPCHPLSTLASGLNASKVEPIPSEWLNTWMKEFQTEKQKAGTSSAKNIYMGVGIGAGVVVLLVIVAVLIVFFCRRRRNAAKDKLDNPSNANDHDDPSRYADIQCNGDQMFNYVAMPQYSQDVDSERRTASSFDAMSYRPSMGINPRPSLDNRSSEASLDSSSLGNSSTGGLQLLPILRNDPHLANKRIPYESIDFKFLLSKGAFGEVWACSLRTNGSTQEVAVKRLIEGKTHKYEEIQEFANEIQLSASLHHPNVVEFIGVAWSTLSNLVLVMELLPTGDLLGFLSKQGDLLTWARDKIHIAIGIARGIEYLHTLDPPLIHRDLKSKNVLLTKELTPKIVDFGVTRRRAEETMTAGIGTPYWTAPEVLKGERYTEQSDIYSFGVMLSEIDTCRLPYDDAIGPNGLKIKPFQVLDGVMSNLLRPSFSDGCPSRVRRLGVACMQTDPLRRPAAKDLVAILGG